MSLLADAPSTTVTCGLHPTSIPIWYGLAALPPGPRRHVVALGVFDGVHRGHEALLRSAVALGEERELPVVMVTFDPHPARIVGAPRDTSTLSSLPQRAEWAHEVGIDAVVVLPFTGALAALSPTQFVDTVLVDALGADAVVVGANFTFGMRGAGTSETLVELGATRRFSTHAQPLVPVAASTCSSTHIRSCLRRGDVVAAARALGRPHQLDARARRGVLVVDEHAALPAPGCYEASFAVEGRPDTAGRVTVDAARQLRPHQPLSALPNARVLVSLLDLSGR